mmetsp:Transcript_42204/g.98936  ORF Transcript_42204/g.98936 Transcript_42204/m.98936 type:complete len:90 (+) Transcript_42204:214-483(+)
MQQGGVCHSLGQMKFPFWFRSIVIIIYNLFPPGNSLMPREAWWQGVFGRGTSSGGDVWDSIGSRGGCHQQGSRQGSSSSGSQYDAESRY